MQTSLYDLVLSLREMSLTYSQIIKETERQLGVKLSRSVVSDWVNHRHVPAGRVRTFKATFSPELAYIIGVQTGDGSLNLNRYNYRIRLKAKDLDFVQEFDRCLSHVLQTIRHKVWQDSETKDYQLDVSSYLLYKLLRRPLQQLMGWIEYDVKCVCAFLRGFFDSEGCVSEKGAVTASNTNLDLLEYVRSLLAGIGVETTEPRIRTRKGSLLLKGTKTYVRKSDCYGVYVRVRSLQRFAEMIGFTISRKSVRLTRRLSTS
jgi:intein-encoded DNA endonuclease-like protein